ncbi:MAG: archease [Candidatus Aenigmarchaeota archaeon]|nr:archease [Candidatus Aenigmarchaeota archaeon]
MKKFEYLEHTADAKFKSYGVRLDEAFSNAALAVFNIMVNTEKVEPKIKKEIKITGKNKETLLFDFIDELLFFLDSENFILHKVEKLTITEKDGIYNLKATALGDEIDKKYNVAGIVKAITYNEMAITEKDGKWEITVVVDR